MRGKEILNDKLNYSAFMESIRFVNFNDYIDNTYASDDTMMFITDERGKIKILDCSEGGTENPRIVTIKKPKTVQDALNSLAIIFNSEQSEEEQQEVLDNYNRIANGVTFLRL